MSSSSPPDKDALIASFVSLTGAQPDTARFFLDAAAWKMDAAAAAFYENPAAQAIPASDPPPRMAAASVPPRGAIRQSAPRVAGLSDIVAPASADDDDEQTQDYYAGGEKSGQVVRGPKKPAAAAGSAGPGPENDMTRALLEQARNAGAPPPEEMEAFRAQQTFTGAGFRLGDTDAAESDAQRKPDVVGRKNVTKVLTFYRDGFTVDEGEFRRLDDPRNQEFLVAIQRGFVPAEMEEPGVGNVSVNLIDKHNEDYVAPTRPTESFAGSGMRLGGPSSSAPAASTDPAPPPATSAEESTVDESLPVITVQLRLHDGTKLRARFNEHHTVGHLRQYAAQARPTPGVFELRSSYPPRKLDDNSQTLKDSNLNGAVVLQSLVS